MTMSCSRFLWIAAGAAVLATVPPVHAADPGDCSPDAVPSAPAQRIAIDPRTGMIAAVPPSASAAPRTAVRSVPLAGVRLESGATRVDLKGRGQMAVVAHRDASGAITTTCSPASARTGKQDPAAAVQGEVPREK
jgi:hypothetical protein